jgi:hypothetical protein
MAGINITEKQLDILINGNLQSSYNQRANSANYDVSVSDVQSFRWNTERDITFSISSEDTQVDLTDIPTSGWYYIESAFSSGETGGDNYRIRRNGSNILGVQDFNTSSKLINLNSGDDISYYCYDGFGNEAYFLAERCTNEIYITDRQGNNYRIPTGFDVDGISQS